MHISTPNKMYLQHCFYRMMNDMLKIEPADVLLVEGILVLYCSEIRDVLDMKLFVDIDADTRLSKRVLRDINERGRDLETILYQYLHYVKPAYEEFCLPTKKYADVIIPSGGNNPVALQLIVQHIQEILRSPSSPPSSTQPETSLRSRHISESFVVRPH
ncbi:unnamed protein product [Soboliphyme baturini]|uniref:PRK domain-containing protein n=1 Tax=Soboliphyme baturini TaxID=241478 RepID=A0A183J555_9BILA|nr:unnamed protein product [Soboliphyme baturini]